MKRTAPVSTSLLLLAVTALGPIGCGGEEQAPRIEKSRLAPTQPVEATSAPQREAEESQIERLVVWPEGAGAPRDARADYRVCRDELDQTPDLRNAHPLVQFDWMRGCMTGKGWAINPDTGIPED